MGSYRKFSALATSCLLDACIRSTLWKLFSSYSLRVMNQDENFSREYSWNCGLSTFAMTFQIILFSFLRLHNPVAILHTVGWMFMSVNSIKPAHNTTYFVVASVLQNLSYPGAKQFPRRLNNFRPDLRLFWFSICSLHLLCNNKTFW